MSWFKRVPQFAPMFTKEGVARIYEFDGQLFVCSVAGISETDSLSVFPDNVDSDTLGEAAIHHLMEYDQEDSRDMREAKRHDWKAFKESGAKSVKAFEDKLWHVDVRISNGDITIEARPRLSLKSHLEVTAHARCTDPEKVGAAVKEAIHAAKTLQANGLM
ncbi:hypothetical protein [Sphingopyxis sp. JAI128]|uniref:hypothetical protein n=1 Tax=Sphingopyxis sp. JAI128 TaxID=2723066 RepID=UPI00160995CF|nr:hypothetical protein [Sphingopyxis sp. JAI128]MBB6427315.1 hypothetical protein [Sphingopyxis sp. JAI128]